MWSLVFYENLKFIYLVNVCLISNWMRGSLPIVPSTARARRMALSACRAAVVPRHGTTRKNPFVSCLGRHLGTMARHGTKMPLCLIGPGRFGPGHFGLMPCSGRATRLEYYIRLQRWAWCLRMQRAAVPRATTCLGACSVWWAAGLVCRLACLPLIGACCCWRVRAAQIM
jgi:hypothetical protein